MKIKELFLPIKVVKMYTFDNAQYYRVYGDVEILKNF